MCYRDVTFSSGQIVISEDDYTKKGVDLELSVAVLFPFSGPAFDSNTLVLPSATVIGQSNA